MAQDVKIKKPMMLLCGDQEIDDYALLKSQMDGIKRAGFDSVCLEFRGCRYDEFDSKGRETIDFVYKYAREIGLAFIKIIPHFLRKQWLKYPDLRGHIVCKKEVTVLDGEICEADYNWEGKLPVRIAATYYVISQGDKVVFEKKDELSEIPFTNLSDITGLYQDGKYVLYFEYETDSINFSANGIDIIAEEFAELLRDYKISGFALDEFGAGSRIKGAYLYDRSFLDRFEAKYGYKLENNLYLLEDQGDDLSFAKVRYDYYALTNDITYEYQNIIKKKFQKRFGEDLFIGFHHTWVGEGNSGDLWAGNIDYFRLADNLSGGFVDAQYDSERTMNSLNLFAESIGKYQDKPAYNMCWDRYTTPEKFDYFHRVLAIRNINWVGHAVSKTVADANPKINAFISKVDATCCWGEVLKSIRRADTFSDFIGRSKSEASVAVVYSWESCAYFNNDYMHYHRLSIKALTDKLIINNIPVEIVPSDTKDLGKYSAIFVPWAVIMHDSLWNHIKRSIGKEQKIIIFGPPAAITADGSNIQREFFDLFGIDELEKREFCGGYECYIWDLWFNDNKIPMQMYADKGNRTFFSNANVSYYAYELPLTDAFYDVLLQLKEFMTIPSDKVISKVYQCEDEKILAVTARWAGEINEKIMFDGSEIEVKHCKFVGIKSSRRCVKEIIADPNALIFVNGTVYDHKPLQ